MKKYRVVRKGFDESCVLVGPRTGNFMYFVEESYITWFGFGKESWRIANDRGYFLEEQHAVNYMLQLQERNIPDEVIVSNYGQI
jgi:hypothetical protein